MIFLCRLIRRQLSSSSSSSKQQQTAAAPNSAAAAAANKAAAAAAADTAVANASFKIYIIRSTRITVWKQQHCLCLSLCCLQEP